jgi:transposase-like protein
MEVKKVKKRKQYTGEEKIAILRKHLLEGVPVSDVCDEHGLQPTVFYRWQKQLFERGAVVFRRPQDTEAKKLRRRVEQLEGKLSKKNEVLGELVEEYVELKKELGAP